MNSYSQNDRLTGVGVVTDSFQVDFDLISILLGAR